MIQSTPALNHPFSGAEPDNVVVVRVGAPPNHLPKFVILLNFGSQLHTSEAVLRAAQNFNHVFCQRSGRSPVRLRWSRTPRSLGPALKAVPQTSQQRVDLANARSTPRPLFDERVELINHTGDRTWWVRCHESPITIHPNDCKD